jgi:hypothetical protein
VDIVQKRLANHRLARAEMQTPAEVVRWLGAVQAQDYLGAKWALGLRGRSITEADVDRAFDAGEILRTHILRPTWHFVTPADIRWMLALSAPRLQAVHASIYRKLELDPRTLRRGRTVMERALRGKSRTRAELRSILERAGIRTDSLRLVHLLLYSELEGGIVSGPRRGKQLTWALLDERAPGAKPLDRDESLGRLTRRYFSSHGPATLRDYAWWSGLTVPDAKRGIDIVKADLSESAVDGLSYWSFRASRARARKPPSSGHLLPNYDEYLIAYKDRGPVVAGAAWTAFSHSLLLDGRLAGTWRRTYTRDTVAVEVEAVLYRRPSKAEARAIAGAAERYRRFACAPVVLSGI